MNNEDILTYYYTDEAFQLRKLCDQVLLKLGKFPDPTEFYSLADIIFVDVLNRWDGNRDFRGLLYTALSNKFKTELTGENREKRKCNKLSVSIHNTLPGTDVTYEAAVPDKLNLEKEVLSDGEDEYKEIREYLDHLSKKQRKVAMLLADGYENRMILEILNITQSEFNDCMLALKASRNLKYLHIKRI